MEDKGEIMDIISEELAPPSSDDPVPRKEIIVNYISHSWINKHLISIIIIVVCAIIIIWLVMKLYRSSHDRNEYESFIKTMPLDEDEDYTQEQSSRDYTEDPARDPVRDPARDPVKDPVRDPARDPTYSLEITEDDSGIAPEDTALSSVPTLDALNSGGSKSLISFENRKPPAPFEPVDTDVEPVRIPKSGGVVRAKVKSKPPPAIDRDEL